MAIKNVYFNYICPTIVNVYIYKFHALIKANTNTNFELGTAIWYVNVEIYFLTIIKHIAAPSSKLEFPIIQLVDLWKGARLKHCFHQIQLDTIYQPIWKSFTFISSALMLVFFTRNDKSSLDMAFLLLFPPMI